MQTQNTLKLENRPAGSSAPPLHTHSENQNTAPLSPHLADPAGALLIVLSILEGSGPIFLVVRFAHVVEPKRKPTPHTNWERR